MGLFGVLLLCFGTFCITFAAECVPETAKCSIYWEKVLPHKDLIATEDELDVWCSKQALFYKCLESVLLEGKNGNISYLPTNLLISKMYTEDLCSGGSTSRRRHLSNAGCINELNTDFCVLPEYLDIVTPDDAIPSTRCSQAEKTFSCIAATIVLNCGFDAGRVYRTMLKITRYSDEVCDIEASEGIPPCEESYSKPAEQDKLSEIYYGLFHRIGDSLDQDENKLAELPAEDIAAHMDEIVTEAIQSALDSLDEDLVSEDCDTPDCRNAEDSDSIPCTEDIKEYKPYMKNPIITEVFREVLFYNYSGLEYAVYWRQPDFTVIDNFECEHLQPSYMRSVIFRCKIEYRHNDPDCLSNAGVHEKVTPEFIRNFDPEVPCDSVAEYGLKPEWMKAVDKAYEERRIQEEMRTESSAVTEASSVFTTSSSLLHMASAMYSIKKPGKWFEFDLQENSMNSIFPNDIHYEMLNLFMPNPENYAPPPMNRIKVGDTIFFLIYDPELTSGIENLTCSRLDECNPRGRGLWKCKMWRRKIETCDNCETVPTEDGFITIPVASQFGKPRDSEFSVLETTEATLMDEESGVLADATPVPESIALIFSGDAENEQHTAFEHSVDEVELVEDFNDKDSSEEDESEDNELQDADKIEYSLISDSDDNVRLQILTSVLNTDEDSESSEVVYEIEGSDAEDNESQIIIAEDGHEFLNGNILLLKDVSDLNESKYTIFSTPDTDDGA